MCSSDLEVTIFPRTYEATHEVWNADEILLVNARVEVRDETVHEGHGLVAGQGRVAARPVLRYVLGGGHLDDFSGCPPAQEPRSPHRLSRRAGETHQEGRRRARQDRLSRRAGETG